MCSRVRGALDCSRPVEAPPGDRELAARYTTWSSYLGGAHSAQFTALDQITTSNVSRLPVAWSFPAGNRTFLFSPLVADGLVFVLAGANDLVALDAATGAQVWSRPHPGAVGTRGLNYWRSADGRDRRLLYIAGGFLTAVDARTGQAVTAFGQDGRVDLRAGARGAPAGRSTGLTPLQTEQSGTRLRGPHHRQPAGTGRWLRLEPGRRPRVRRAHRSAAMGVSLAAARGRAGRRHVAERRAHHSRRRPQLERADDRRGARYRLRAVRHRTLRLLRRRPPGPEPVRQQPRRARRAHRQAAVALPDRSPRCVGLRPAGRRRSS